MNFVLSNQWLNFSFVVELAFYVNERGFRSRQTEIAWPTPITHLGTLKQSNNLYRIQLTVKENSMSSGFCDYIISRLPAGDVSFCAGLPPQVLPLTRDRDRHQEST